MANIGDLVATATLDIAPFMTNTKNLKTHLKGLDKSLSAMEKSFKGQGNNLKNLGTLYRQTSESLRSYQSVLSKQSEKYNALKAEIGDVNKATEAQKGQLVGARNAMVETAAKVAELQNKMKGLEAEIVQQNSKFYQLGKSLENFSQKANEVGKRWSNIGRSFDGIGNAFTKGVTVPLMGGAGLAVKAAIDYESAFAGVKKTVDETVDSNGKVTYSYEKLSRGIRNMSKEIPASAVEIANVAEVAGQLGIKTPDILNFTRTMVDMGESTNLSATEAASSLAKFSNIVQMSPSLYRNLGSAIVDLGNNFATTEKDIVEMGLRLAGTGHLVGLTEPQILGLATAMSSVGINAEAGGSAMSRVMQKINTAVASGGDELAKFASVAGKSANDFTNSWKKNPQEAIISFIKGLGRIKDSGGDVTATLKELDVRSIQEIDTMQRLAGAGDLLGKAFDTANKSFKDNTALTEEANKRYETTASKLKKLRNEATDIAIEFGGPLIDALRDALQAGKPILSWLADTAKAFSSLDKSQQQSIIKWGLFAASIGPVFKILGTGAKTIGSVSTALGSLTGFFSKKLLATGAAEVASIGTSAVTAEAGVSTLAGSLGILGNPVTWGVILGGVAIAGITKIATEFGHAYQRTKEWGTAVSETQANELSAFKNKVDETNRAMTVFETDSVKSVDGIKSAFQGLTDEITKLSNKKLAKDLKLAEKLGLSEETINTIKKNAERTVDNVQHMSDEVIKIYQNASEQHRELTAQEKAVVLSNQNELIDAQLELMNFSKDEQVKIRKAMNGELDDLNTAQVQKALTTLGDWIKEENKLYDKRVSEYKEMLSKFQGDDEASVKARADINAQLEKLEAEHQAKMDAFGEKYMALRQKLAENDKKLYNGNKELQKAQQDAIKKELESLGLSYEEFSNRAVKSMETAQQSSSLWAKTTKEATTEVAGANNMWNSLVWDEKKGELKTNAKEELQKAIEAENGWENIKFIAKNANLESNARIMIGEALIESGKWNDLSIEDKNLIVGNSSALQAIIESKENLRSWNSMPEEVKQLLGNNDSFLNSAEGATNLLNAWNLMTPLQKELTAQNLTGPDVDLAQQTINSLMGTEVGLKAVNETGQPVADATQMVNDILQNVPISIKAQNDTQPEVNSSQKSVDSVNRKSPVEVKASNNTHDGVRSAKATIDSVQDKTVTITTVYNNVVNTFKRIFGHEKGTEFHPGGLAMVNDQRGAMYKELVTLPTGESFIPEGRNVILPLPRGSKVLKASRTRNLMRASGIKHYAKGIGFNDTKIAQITAKMNNIRPVENNVLESQMNTLIELLKDNNQSVINNNNSFTLNANGGSNSDFFSRDNMKRLLRELAYYTQAEGGRLTQ